MRAETTDDLHGRRGMSALKLKNRQVGRLLKAKWDATGTRKVALLETRRYTAPHRASLLSGAEPNRKCRMKKRMISMGVFCAMLTFFTGEASFLRGEEKSADKSAVAKPNTLKPDKKGFDTQAGPFLQKYCIQCHGNKKQENDLNLETLSGDMSNPEVGGTWNDVY
ncbi:MAG: c-type cytochrome domain-containing protein, partial [Pirellulales bacterium]